MSFSSHAGGRPRPAGRARCLCRRRLLEGPGKDAAHVLALIGLAGLLGLLAEDPLVDPNVLVVAQVRLNDVVETRAGRRPPREHQS